MQRALRRRRITALGGTIAVVLASVLVLASPLSAATGNAALGRHLIHDPIAHGVGLPSSVLTPYYNAFVSQGNAAVQGSGVKETIAVNGWNAKHNKQQLLIVTLIAITGKGKSATFLNGLAAGTAAGAGKNVCTGASKSAPALDQPVATLPNSAYVQCPPSASGTVVVSTAVARANVVAVIVTSSTTVSLAALAKATRQQYGLLPKAGFRTS